jgi:Family of unknown function (DUF6325)
MVVPERELGQEEGLMSTEDIELGPIDYLVVEWPAGKEPNGEGLKHLVDLTDRGLIRVIDLAFVRKNEDGSVEGMAITDLDADGTLDLVEFEGASSGLLGDDEYEEASGVLEPGASAAILVYENTWAAPFATALRKNGAQLVANGRIPVNDLIQKLEQLEAAEA